MSGVGEVADRRDLGAFIPAELDDYGLDPYEFRIYSRIVRRAGGVRGCDESTANIAKAVGCGDVKVRESLKLLVAAGLVDKEVRPGTSDRYTLRPSSEWAPSEELPALRKGARRKQYDTPVRQNDRSDGARSDGTPDPTERGTPVPRNGDHDPTERAPRSDGTTKVLPEGSPGKGKSSASPRSAATGRGEHLLHLALPDGRTIDLDLDDPEACFDGFWWPTYPRHPKTNARGGGGSHRISRQRWLKLSAPKRRAALEALPNYLAHLAVSGSPPVYAEKWLSQQQWETYAAPPATGAEGLDVLDLALADVSGIDPDTLTGEGRRDLVTAAAAIGRAGGTPDMVAEVARKWATTWPQIPIAPLPLARHWGKFASQLAGRRTGPLCGHCGQPRDGHDDQLCQLLGKVS